MSAVPDQIGLGRQRPHAWADTAGFDFTSRLAELRGVGAPSIAGYCRSDGMMVDIQPMSGDFEVEPAMLDVLLAQLYDASLGAGSIGANAASTVRGIAQGAMQRNARINIQKFHDRIASGALRTARINEHMTLYNANAGKGRPRVRLRVTNMPVKVLAPIGGAQGWRTNRAGTTHSAGLRNPSAATTARASAMAGELGWNSRLGWLSGRTGTGVLTFAPTAVIDAYSSAQWEIDAAGRQRYQGMDWNDFAVRSARNQSGNAVGVAAGFIATTAIAKGALGVGVAAAVAGAPLVLIGLAVGIAAVFVWNATGMGEGAGNLMERALGR